MTTKQFLQKIHPAEKKHMRSVLKQFRDRNASHSISVRLKTFPFINTRALFGTENWMTPCQWFGRHLVLKIIDEILDTGEEIT